MTQSLVPEVASFPTGASLTNRRNRSPGQSQHTQYNTAEIIFVPDFWLLSAIQSSIQPLRPVQAKYVEADCLATGRLTQGMYFEQLIPHTDTDSF